MAIASHKDFALLEDFFSECEEEELRVFLAYVEESLSLQVISYFICKEKGLDVDKPRNLAKSVTVE